MKALILSDSHGSFSDIAAAVEIENDISMIIFAGDIQKDVDEILRTYPQIPTVYVLGNNDWFVHDVPYDRIFELCGKRIFLTHGHKYGVKSSLYKLRQKAREIKADICIFGHTHSAFFEIQDDIYIINPGTAWKSYAILSIDDDNINVEIKKSK